MASYNEREDKGYYTKLTAQGVNVAFDHTSAFFDHLQEDKSRAKRYGSAMQAQSSREGYDVSHTVESYPWSKLGTATIVDVSHITRQMA